jgi:predicted metal-binding membrane protein
MNTKLSDASRIDVRVVVLGLFFVVGAAWIYLRGGPMSRMRITGGDMMQMQMSPAWTFSYAATIFAMWAVMMLAMMLPVGAPGTLRAVRGASSAPPGPGGLSTALAFTGAYMLVWLGFGVSATLLQWGLDSADLLSDDMAVRSRLVGGSLAIAVGLYQFSPLKQEALRRCRSSDDDRLPNNTSRSLASVWRLGLRHGLSCLSCCWALMLLPFIGGLMNPVWMAAATLLALAERIFPRGDRVARLSGAGLIVLGGYLLAIAVQRCAAG